MADLINSSRPVRVSSRLDTAAHLLTDPVVAGVPELTAGAGLPADSDDSARFREDIRRRCEAPLLLPRRHDGLNE
jgi:hypothetical protein